MISVPTTISWDRVQMKIKKILVPTDFSVNTNQVISYAGLFSRTFHAELFLIHVIEGNYAMTDTLTVIDTSEALKATASALLDNLRKELLEKGIVVQVELAFGHPHQEIEKTVERLGIDLIVMGTHGRSGLEHLLIGSVAERVVRTAPCPVLTIRTWSDAPSQKSS